MASQELFSVKLGKSWIGKADRIFHCVISTESLICCHDPNTGVSGILLIAEKSDYAEVRKFLSELRSNLGESWANLIAKIVGPHTDIDRLRSELVNHGISSIKLQKVDARSDAFFYSNNARLRVGAVSANTVTAQPARAEVKKKKVLIVDDSKTIRDLLRKMFGTSPDLEVVADVALPSQVEKAILEHKPDVITLDIHMPEMDGVKLLETLLPKYRIPTVMISSLSLQESNLVLRALEIGAVDYIQKPSFDELGVIAPILIEKVVMAAKVRVPTAVREANESDAKGIVSGAFDFTHLVAIGSSTGGTEALRKILVRLPEQFPPILIVQHIPPVFSTAFVNRLNDICALEIKEAEDGDEVRNNRVLVAPGGKQMFMVEEKSTRRVRVTDDPPVNRHKPSVDVLFDSVAKYAGRKSVGVLLTGMGADGAKGLLRMKERGAKTIAQDEKSSTVFGMPRAAIQLGAAEFIESLDDIPERIGSCLTPVRKNLGAA